MINSNMIVEKEQDRQEFGDVIITQFKGLAKKYLQFDSIQEIDYSKLVNEKSRIYSYSLPEEISEMFIKCDEAPYFWIYRTPIILYLEEHYKTKLQHAGDQSNYRIIKDFYTKWLINKSEDEKKYFASSALNLLGRKSNSPNLLNEILYAVILGFEKHVMNPAKGIELLETSKELVSGQNFQDNVKDELNYLINLYQGFIDFEQDQNEEALKYFSQALSIKPFGITAKFHVMLNSLIVQDIPFDSGILNDFFSYDISRIEYAIDKNDLLMMNYFIKYAVINNIFYYPELSRSYTEVFDLFSGIRNSNEFDLGKLKANLYNFKNLNLSEYSNDVIINDISILEKLFKSYFNEENIFFKGLSGKLYNKFRQVVENIISSINQKYYKDIKQRLKIYEDELLNKTMDLQSMIKDLEDRKNLLKEKLNSTIKVINSKAAENIAYLENRIENIHNEQGYDPKITFKNAMTYNLILSFTTFLMGGCAEYSNTFMSETTKYSQFLPDVVIAGFKWGMIAFIIGLVISLITAGLSLLEGSNQKQKLLQAINRIKDDKDYQIEYYKKDMERKERDYDALFKKSTEDKRKYIDKLKLERDAQEKKYNEEVQIQIEEESKPLVELIS